MRRIQIHIDEDLDAAVTAEAARRGVSKAAFIRACLRGEARVPRPPVDDAWESMIGWADIDPVPVESIDDVVYGLKG